ncbi:sensor histidine kinase [Adonisia turfae]|uniref:histidine kinase n=1 Tax=Adonisia turfae CCMR0081 TaxID=2292702 RepID=A0A6M0RUN5_9CYAN|nr:ATP-binding protein [Adonisia turfae]NEZ59869.1 PAS domain S-box protein [Adonisia turfae CCMR0081]
MLEPEKVNELYTQIQYRLIEKVTESERRYRTLVENLREIVFECDYSGVLTFINRAWTETLGYAFGDVVGKSLDQFINEDDIHKWQTALQMQIDCYLELRFYADNGSLLWLELAMRFEDSNSLSGALINITERKQAETFLRQANEQLEDRVRQRTLELISANQKLQHTIRQLQYAQGQLVHKEKMSSLGRLVAGVAHEINNPVSFVHCNLEPAQAYAQELLSLLGLYQQHYPQPAESIQSMLDDCDIEFIKGDFPKLLSSMESGTERIRKIVDSLRGFSRVDEALMTKVDIHKGIDDTLLILNHRFKGKNSEEKGIQLIKSYGELPLIDGFPDQLNQVFMNLLSNAIDALLAVEKNDASVLGNTLLNSVPVLTICTHAQNGFVNVEISDNGPGISEDIISRVFEPFFTTKPVGKGTGLGLSISHQIIVENHHGQISCSSDIGQGTTFKIQMPINGAGVEDAR